MLWSISRKVSPGVRSGNTLSNTVLWIVQDLLHQQKATQPTDKTSCKNSYYSHRSYTHELSPFAYCSTTRHNAFSRLAEPSA